MTVPENNSPKSGSWVLADISDRDRKRRTHLAIALPFLIVPLLMFATINITQDSPVFGSLQLSGSIMLLISMIGLRYVQNAFPLFRINIALLSILVVYSVWAGYHQGAAILSLYLYPVILFYFLGRLEGAIWVALVLVPTLLILFLPEPIGAYVYAEPYTIRLAATMLLVAAFSYLNESLRQEAYQSLDFEKENLAHALAEIKTLRGIIPICSYCKKIRDDDGIWNQIEKYVRDRSDADFTHSICPDCVSKYSLSR
mgnify:CR=1 FL=1|jgi:hypothetical protein|tara:strand:+ start:2458 stop:3225 length:768 start_codon:yes stop_codon:yes gene_type:complete